MLVVLLSLVLVCTAHVKNWCGNDIIHSNKPSLKRQTTCQESICEYAAKRDTYAITNTTRSIVYRLHFVLFVDIEDQIPGQMELMNRIYGPMKMSFKYTVSKYLNTPYGRPLNTSRDEKLLSAMRTQYSKDPKSFLNIFVVGDLSTATGMLYGQATFPSWPTALTSMGGILMNGNHIYTPDREEDPSLGYTLVHEFGHCVGLRHTFESSYVTENEVSCDACSELSGKSNDITGDFCSDTPATSQNYECGEPTLLDCSRNKYINTAYRNPMAYSKDTCMKQGTGFTPQQMALARCSIDNFLTSHLEERKTCKDKSECPSDPSNLCNIPECRSGICGFHALSCPSTACSIGSCVSGQCVNTSVVCPPIPNQPCVVAKCNPVGGCFYNYSGCDKPKPTNDCCKISSGGGCVDDKVTTCVCTINSACCSSTGWNSYCVKLANGCGAKCGVNTTVSGRNCSDPVVVNSEKFEALLSLTSSISQSTCEGVSVPPLMGIWLEVKSTSKELVSLVTINTCRPGTFHSTYLLVVESSPCTFKSDECYLESPLDSCKGTVSEWVLGASESLFIFVGSLQWDNIVNISITQEVLNVSFDMSYDDPDDLVNAILSQIDAFVDTAYSSIDELYWMEMTASANNTISFGVEYNGEDEVFLNHFESFIANITHYESDLIHLEKSKSSKREITVIVITFEEHSGLTAGQIAGIVIGSVFGALIILLILGFVLTQGSGDDNYTAM